MADEVFVKTTDKLNVGVLCKKKKKKKSMMEERNNPWKRNRKVRLKTISESPTERTNDDRLKTQKQVRKEGTGERDETCHAVLVLLD